MLVAPAHLRIWDAVHTAREWGQLSSESQEMGVFWGSTLGLDLEPFAFFYTIVSYSVTEVEPAYLVFCRDIARKVNDYF